MGCSIPQPYPLDHLRHMGRVGFLAHAMAEIEDMAVARDGIDDPVDSSVKRLAAERQQHRIEIALDGASHVFRSPAHMNALLDTDRLGAGFRGGHCMPRTDAAGEHNEWNRPNTLADPGADLAQRGIDERFMELPWQVSCPRLKSCSASAPASTWAQR